MELSTYRRSIENRLQMWDAQIRLLEARLLFIDDTSPHRAKSIRMLRRKWQALHSSLCEVAHASDDVWYSIKENVEHVFADLEQSFESLGTVHAEEHHHA